MFFPQDEKYNPGNVARDHEEAVARARELGLSHQTALYIPPDWVVVSPQFVQRMHRYFFYKKSEIGCWWEKKEPLEKASHFIVIPIVLVLLALTIWWVLGHPIPEAIHIRL